MFNGIIFNKGTIKNIKKNSKSILIGIKSNLKIKKEELGSSISCNGVCLTLVKIMRCGQAVIKTSSKKYKKGMDLAKI